MLLFSFSPTFIDTSSTSQDNKDLVDKKKQLAGEEFTPGHGIVPINFSEMASYTFNRYYELVNSLFTVLKCMIVTSSTSEVNRISLKLRKN